MRKKKILLIISMMVFVLCITGCGKKKEKNSCKSVSEIIEDIKKSDLSNEVQNEQQEKYELKEVKINKRNTQDKKKDEVYVSVIFENGNIRKKGEYKLTYNYYTTGG